MLVCLFACLVINCASLQMLCSFFCIGWSYGIGDEADDLILDITNDETGETHLRARENIPMHVNEVGHDPHLVHNVTPLELNTEKNIHYFAHPKEAMKVGDTIELLVNYGEMYEEVRERKGYGKSRLGGDDIDSQRVKRNQAERVKIEDLIYTRGLEEIYDMLIALQVSIDSILRTTDMYLQKELVPDEMSRFLTARFRLHWVEPIFRKRCNALSSRGKESLLYYIGIILDKMKAPAQLTSPHFAVEGVVRQYFVKEILEENVFAASKNCGL